jgi:UDP-galactopyranose mutase
MGKKRILILGAGLAGLSAAWHLQEKGRDYLIFEKESDVGGLSRSKIINGFTFDYCGHLLHFKHRYTFNLIKKLLGNNLLKHQRSAWVYSQGRYSRYPFQVNLYGLPASIIKECLLGFIHASGDGKLKKDKNLNFLYWINQTFGKGIARHFMIPYNTKFWTVSPEELTCEWLDGFIPVPSLNQIVEGTIKESKRQFGYNARFWYPREGGIGQLSLALANQIRHIYTDCRITEINLAKKEIKMASGNRESYDCLITTIPLPEMQYLIKNLSADIRSAFKKLKWNSVFNLNLGMEKNNSDGQHWIYFPQKEICFFRVGFFHNFSPNLAPADKDSLYIEVSYPQDKPVDKSDITFRIKDDLKKAGIIREDNQICREDINDIKYGYPIYDKNYSLVRSKISGFLLKNNIISCGRYGSWRYMSMEDALLDGKSVAESYNF